MAAVQLVKYLQFATPPSDEAQAHADAGQGLTWSCRARSARRWATDFGASRARFTIPAGKLEDDLVWQAIWPSSTDSKLMPTIEAWKKADRLRSGRKARPFPVRALLVAMVVCAVTNEPMLATAFTDVLFRQISRPCAMPSGSRSHLTPDDVRAGTTATATSGPGSTG